MIIVKADIPVTPLLTSKENTQQSTQISNNITMYPATLINMVLLCILNIFFMIGGIILNSVVINCLRKSSQLRKKLCYFMILLLSCFDLAVVTIVHPVQILSTIFLFLGDYNHRFEEMRASLCLLLNGFSMFALSALSLERFLALTYPIFHRALVTKGKLLIYLALTIISLVGLFPLMYYNRTIGGIVTSVYLCLFLILFVYLNYKMFLVVKSKQKEEKSDYNVGRKTRKLNFKNISTCCLAVLCFFICSCPYIIYSCLGFSYMANTPYRQRLSHHIWSNTFVSMNSTFNCLIFFWRNSILYREGMKILKCFRTGKS